MTTPSKPWTFAAALLSIVVSSDPLSTALAQGTTFTYQGQLQNNRSPASGNYDLTFALFDTNSAGTPLGGTLTNIATAVSNGLFTVTLDFGSQFPGANRWLEIGVRTNGGGAFASLAPRQPLTPTPYAVFAGGANAAGLRGLIPAAQLPATVLTNGASGANLAGTFSGNFSGNAATATTAGNFSGNLAGDVAGAQSATVVATVGGVTAVNVAAGANIANAATNANTAGAIVKRDASGNFSAGTVTANAFVGDGSALRNLTGGTPPGTAIPVAPFTITNPGSYYLTQNLAVVTGDALTINASGVSLYLNGFTISSTAAPAAGAGIRLVRPNSDISIVDGHIRGGVTFDGTNFSSGPGFQFGIGLSGAAVPLQTVRVAAVSVSGVSGLGIADLGNASVIDSCVVSVAAGGGVSASAGSVLNSMAYNCGVAAITGAVVSGSRGLAVQGGTGIVATVANNSIGASDTGTGLSAQTVTGSYGSSTSGKGLVANSVNSSYATGTPATTRLLFPFVSNANGFETGISIANTGVDSTGTNGIAGTATAYFYGDNAPASPIVFPNPELGGQAPMPAGKSYATTLTQVLAQLPSAPATFTGYLEVDCNFPLAHGSAFLIYGSLGSASATMSEVPVLVLPPKRSAALPESLGQ